ncbi:Uncharacterized protein OS=Blastopirellula marina DSM 3645 GN=DSM3645_18766 PE=4 SV=1: Prenyltrans_2 [Gemmataceae bacterium]|nr:Uncharacterized protein OS=Blastopirellula marina DSM 3645 GN=DSM3645_18766 PE=4 SV=1: Prenyltrans_2 [Gemmataceae bacterium]VTU01350.1 Uncharacterized protein OS=Blastopirellula marina DSM 3645 GN=DSM3645_18766 PE=4 SV=1: Prenyltrans_2 [Gemmataceae bacterium]
MSESKPVPAAAAVIRRLDHAEETAQERLMRKHVPAWVISGAVHVGVIALLILMFGSRGAEARLSEKIIATSVENEEEAPEVDLTNEDIGLDSNLEAALPEIDRIDQQTVDAAVTADNLGQPDVPEVDVAALAPPGLALNDASAPGVDGAAGDVMSGSGGGGGQTFASFPGRSGATKSKLLREGGGNEASERAVALGLAWLARQQKQDGGWTYDGSSKDERVAATGMALLPFLAAGETHQRGKRYQKTVASGLQFLLRNCPLSGNNAGRMSGNMYAHAIGALALCEAYGMTRDRGLLLAAGQAAINHIVRAQAANGSWGYSPGSAGDTSIVGWQLQALKAAILGKDIVVPAATMKKAVDFLNLAGAGSRKAMYGYADNAGAAPGTSLTAVGLLSRYYIDGWGPDNAGMAEGVTGLMKKAPVKTAAVPKMYFYYYATQVVHFFEGDEWRTWNEGPKGADGVRKGGMRDWLVGVQVKKDGPNLGSFDPDGDWIGRSCGRLGTTAMCLLTLEVYYRNLPLYKRASAGDGAIQILEGAK